MHCHYLSKLFMGCNCLTGLMFYLLFLLSNILFGRWQHSSRCMTLQCLALACNKNGAEHQYYFSRSAQSNQTMDLHAVNDWFKQEQEFCLFQTFANICHIQNTNTENLYSRKLSYLSDWSEDI